MSEAPSRKPSTDSSTPRLIDSATLNATKGLRIVGILAQATTRDPWKPKREKVQIRMPKLRHLAFESSIIERYKRREASVEEALIEMYLASVSVRRVEDITQALWGTRVSSSTVSDLNKKIYTRIAKWRKQPIEG